MQKDQAPLSTVLDKLDHVAQVDRVSVEQLIETIGHHSFATLMLVFALISISPVSVIPGVTSVIAVLEFILVAQMIAGRRHLWLPEVIWRHTFAGARLREGIGWFRRPLAFTDRILRPRLALLTERPLLYPWLILILVLTLFMPFMELLPGSGTLASSVIALVAAAILTRDGALLVLAGICLVGLVGLVGWLGMSLL